MKLTDNSADQKLLEQLIDRTKPPIPAECKHLDFLMFTPFRYAPYPKGSRFRRAGLTDGVFYAAHGPETAIAEICFYRLLFFSESPKTKWPSDAGEYTAFACEYGTGRGIDLNRVPFVTQRDLWMHLTDFSACQELADIARSEGIDAIIYESVRDPKHGSNIAILTCRVFTSTAPIARLTWRILFGSNGARALCEMPKTYLDFGRAAFSNDPRIKRMIWDR
jgi:hypothetical protein